MKEFILGCNYWASNAGTEMWSNFDIDAIDNDMRLLSEYGVTHIRAFPNWRDFQPVMPLYEGCGRRNGYCLEGEKESENEFYLDETMMERFSVFLDKCKKYNIKVIVGLLTGWMSGRLFIPTVLYDKNLITDPLAQYFELLFVKGFVGRFKDHPAIFAWNMGNECNCLAPANYIEGAVWTGMITGAIKAEDKSHTIISGMSGLSIESKENGGWTIKDQATFTDVLTTHPYAYWGEGTRIDRILSFRTLMYGTMQARLYADIGKKPCFIEEIGTMGPMFCANENAASFFRVNALSALVNDVPGIMWWCGFEQSELKTRPYTENMGEVELGLFDLGFEPKPVVKAMKEFSEFVQNMDFELPKAEKDAVCLLSRTQNQWGVAYMTYILARKAGINLSFAYADDGIPDAKLYMLPSIDGQNVMHREQYDILKEKVKKGADVYISMNNGILSDFDKFIGLRALDSYEYGEEDYTMLNGEKISFKRVRKFITEENGAKTLLRDSAQYPLVTVNKYGEGRVFYVNFPLEDNLFTMHNAFDGNEVLIYKELFKEYIESKPMTADCDEVGLTFHKSGDVMIVVAVNYTDGVHKLCETADCGYVFEKVIRGNRETVAPFDATILQYRLNS